MIFEFLIELSGEVFVDLVERRGRLGGSDAVVDQMHAPTNELVRLADLLSATTLLFARARSYLANRNTVGGCAANTDAAQRRATLMWSIALAT